MKKSAPMKARILVAGLLGVFTLASCSTSSKKDDSVAANTAEGPGRAPSALTDEQEQEGRFNHFKNSSTASKEIAEYVRRVVGIYYRTEEYLKAFDQKLDAVAKNPQSFDKNTMMTDSSYSKLIAARILSERIRRDITDIYTRTSRILSEQGNDSQADRTLKAKALEIKNAIYKSITSFNKGVDRVAIQSLLRDLVEARVAVKSASANKSDSAPPVDLASASMGKMVFGTVGDEVKFINSNQKGILRKIQEAAKIEGLEDEISSTADTVQGVLNQIHNLREPQAAEKIVASAGPNGNLTGSTFPKGHWALTFDDGPSGAYTAQILDSLKKHKISATFFWLAQLSPKYPAIVQRAYQEGHVLGNHSFSHANLPKLGAAGLQKEIVESNEIHTKVYGFKPAFFRCPYGACGPSGGNIRQMIASLGLIHVFWNVDSLDWQDHNPASVYERVKKQMATQGRGIILFHDIHPQSALASEMVMRDLREGMNNGTLRAVNMPEVVNILNTQ
jgi:peptidoglycan/xylan/chitin deacetylase (PgdA/CDA1 family)